MKKINGLLSIDPGDNTGFCIWGNNDYFFGKFNLSAKEKKESMEFQLSLLFEKFKNLLVLKRRLINSVMIEGVKIYSGDKISMVSAKRGNLMKLSYLIGGYCSICSNFNLPFLIVAPTIWKGQMNKDIVKRRILRNKNILTDHWDEKITDHEVDAIGIGLFARGDL